MVAIRYISLFFLVTITGVLGIFPGQVSAATILAASPSYNDVSVAVSSASSGDTVVVPAGTASWNSPLIITKDIILNGAGIEKTAITGNITDQNAGIIKYAPSSPNPNNRFRVTGFTLDGNSESNCIYLENGSIIIENIRIDHNRIINSGGVNAGRGIWIEGTIYGVIDNNSFENTPSSAISSYGRDGDSWTNLSRNFGDANNIYIENNTFTGTSTFLASGQGGRYVARYNTFNWTSQDSNMGPGWDAHGNQPSGFSTMVVELYGNLFDMNGACYNCSGASCLFGHRGGQALMFYNSMINSHVGSASVGVREEYADASYPSINSFLMHVTNSYYWENRRNTTELLTGGIGQDTYDGVNKNVPAILVENREFWQQGVSFDGTTGVGCGTLASRPSTCTTGVGYWVPNATDDPTAGSCTNLTGFVGASPTYNRPGTLYKCTATNTWTAYYTPYTYPHPLVEQATSPPKNLKIGQ